MNLAQSTTLPIPSVPINVRLPDLSKWSTPDTRPTIDRTTRLKTLESIKALLKERGQMDLVSIRQALDDKDPTLNKWMYRWWLAREFEKKSLDGRLVYSLSKGAQ